MKEGYIVWNESNCGSEFFGVYRHFDEALACFRKVIKARFSHCPKSYDEAIDFLCDVEGDDDSYQITYFKGKI